MNSPYSGDFHLSRHSDTEYAAEKILSILLREVPKICSAIDVGCGVGTFLHILKKQGIDEILGLDGDWIDQDMLVIPPGNIQAVNLELLSTLDKKYDLAICLEVAEHLPAENAEKFINFLCNTSDIVLFSAAVPGQGGANHLNEAWQSYWVDLFREHDFLPHDLIRQKIWNDEKISFWYRQNILVYAKAGKESIGQSHSFPLDIIHPELYLKKYEELYCSGLVRRLIRKLFR